MTNQSIDNQPHITQPNQRMQILDILRGFAIFGILAVNITTFILPNHDFIHMNLDASAWYDQFALWFNSAFTEGKFYILFSFLFGIGFSVQLNSLNKKGGDIWSFYPRRLAILFVIGLLHSLLWWGDVLRLYALLGLVLLFLRNVSIPYLLTLSALCLGFSVVVSAFPNVFGGEQMPNANSVLSSIPFALIHMGPTAFALFLLGRVVGQIGFFEHLPKHIAILKKLILIGLIVSISLKLMNYFLITPNSWQATLPKTLADMALTSVYIAILCLLSLSLNYQRFLKPIANVGQMALTNYVMQTLICVGLFKLFGLEGKLQSGALLLLTLAIFVAQMLFSTWWLNRFKYGALEWLWRSLTFGKRQAFLK